MGKADDRGNGSSEVFQDLELRRQDLGMSAIAKRVGVSSRIVWRFLRGSRRSVAGRLTLRLAALVGVYANRQSTAQMWNACEFL